MVAYISRSELVLHRSRGQISGSGITGVSSFFDSPQFCRPVCRLTDDFSRRQPPSHLFFLHESDLHFRDTAFWVKRPSPSVPASPESPSSMSSITEVGTSMAPTFRASSSWALELGSWAVWSRLTCLWDLHPSASHSHRSFCRLPLAGWISMPPPPPLLPYPLRYWPSYPVNT